MVFPVNKRYKWQNYIYNKFKSENIVNEANAKTLDELGIINDYLFRGLMSTGVIINVKDKYFLNEENAIKYFRKRSFIILMAIIGIILLTFILTLLFF